MIAGGQRVVVIQSLAHDYIEDFLRWRVETANAARPGERHGSLQHLAAAHDEAVLFAARAGQAGYRDASRLEGELPQQWALAVGMQRAARLEVRITHGQ